MVSALSELGGFALWLAATLALAAIPDLARLIRYARRRHAETRRIGSEEA